MPHSNVYFVIVRPTYLGNIGSAARVLKNFGFSKLRLVEPPKNYKDSEARRMSVAAFDVLKNAEVFDSLDRALADVGYAVGTTSGQQREIEPLPLSCIVEPVLAGAEHNKVAVVFGDERNGLARSELERCHATMTIPTNPAFPALNMAQAIAVTAYQLHATASAGQTAPVQETYSTGTTDDELFDLIGGLLDRVQFSRKFNRQVVLNELRQFYQRARPTAREADLLKGVLHRLRAELGVPVGTNE